MNDLRKRLITHILHMKKIDENYARYALKHYHEALPWLDLIAGVREALKAPQPCAANAATDP